MVDFHLYWEEILRFAQTHRVEQSDIFVGAGIGLAILVLVILFTIKREAQGEVRDRWVLVALEPGSRTDSILQAFRTKDWDVQLLPPHATLSEFLTGFHPSLLVVDQGIHGNELTRLEATDTKVASTPILYLNSRQGPRSVVPMRAWIAGAGKTKVILEKAEMLVRSAPTPQQLSRKAEVQGPLAPGTLLELLYFQTNTRRTGRMEISYRGLSGWLWIKRGEIRHAVVAGIEGIKALHAMLDLGEGQFSFVAEVDPPKTSIKEPTMFLLHEYARQRDERGKMAGD